MNGKREFHIRSVWAALWMAWLVGIVAMLVSCGGGGAGVIGSGGTGSPAGVTVGTVNGFGSVIVDGLVYDDRFAPVVSETVPGVNTAVEVRLGHRVLVDYEVPGVASRVHVDAAVVGTVASITSRGRFSVLGQTVTTNTNGAVGPITQFGGAYTQDADIRAGDSLEVHGILVRQNGAYTIQATRIDKLAAGPAYLRVTGLASNLGAAGTATLNLGALTVDASASVLLPAGTVLAEGQALTVLALPSSLTTQGNGTLRLKAAQTRVQHLGGGGLDDYVSGSVSNLNTDAKTFTLGSLIVRYTNATVSPTDAVLANSLYVQARGSKAADGSLNATTVTLRDTGSDSEGEVKGTITGYVASNKRFVVRGVTVDASAASLKECPVTGLSDGLFVEIKGALVSTGLKAKTVQCESEPPAAPESLDETMSGPVSGLNVGAKTFVLGNLVIRYSNAAVSPADTALANGLSVQVRGTKAVDGTFSAVTVTVLDVGSNSDSTVKGKITDLVAATKRFLVSGTLVDASSASMQDCPATGLANGLAVEVRGALVGTSLKAKTVQCESQSPAATVESLEETLSGSMSNLNTGAKTFTLGGLVVRYATASLFPAGAALTNGLSVRVRGTKAVDGSLNAGAVTVVDAGSGGEGEVKGIITNYVAVTKRFVVNAVQVDASAASMQGCPATGLANGLLVEIHGVLVSPGLKAQTVQCESESLDATAERQGVVTAVNLSSKTLTLETNTGSSLSVTWSGTTIFNGVTPPALTGKRIQVKGRLVGGVLSASQIELDD